MVNLQFCDESTKIHSNNLSAASCSGEASQASIKRNGSSRHSSKVPVVNGDCKVSQDTPLVNGSYSNKLANGFPTGVGHCEKSVSVENGPIVNGNGSSNVPINYLETGNRSNDKVALELPKVNGSHDDKVGVELPTVNGNHDNIAVEETPAVNGNHDNIVVEDIPTVNSNHDEKVAVVLPTVSCSDSAPTVNENRDDKVAVNELPTVVEICYEDLNGLSTPSENGSVQNDFDENPSGFVTVVNKKKRNKNKNRKKPTVNLPPIKKTENIRRDNEVDKNHNVKTSPAHLVQKPTPSRTVFAVRSSEKSYSSALVNGQSKMSQMKNASQISSNSLNRAFPDVTKCSKVNMPSNNNPELSGTCISPGQLSPAVTNDTLAISQQPNSPIKVEKTDFSGQTDICSENELCQRQIEHLLSQEDVQSIKAPICYTDVDYIKEREEESIDSYCDSVVSDDSGRGDSEGVCDATFRCQFPTVRVPLLIGRRGNYKREVEGKSGAKIKVINLYHTALDFAIVEIKGTLPQIEKAKEIIKERFPNIPLLHYAGVTDNDPLSPYYIASLPEGTNFSGMVSSMYHPNCFWLQQCGHPLAYQLEDLERKMSQHFNTITDAPAVDYPVPGSIVAVAGSKDCNDQAKWLRSLIVNVFPDNATVLVRYLDHGGEYVVPVTGIRQVRHEFFCMPFFAAECSLYGVLPTGEKWSQEAFQEFYRLCNCTRHLTVRVLEKTATNYLVSMQTYDCATCTIVDIATVLKEKGLALPYPDPYRDHNVYQPPDNFEQ